MDDFVLGDRELDVMGVLWELGSGTVTEVRERLPAELAYTTVLTILRNLEAKGFLHHEAEGKAHRYFPSVARRAARRTAVTRLIDKLFHGSPEQLIAQLVEDRALTADDLQRIRRRIDTSEPEKGAKIRRAKRSKPGRGRKQ
ncbi:MAG TPA: BlaI/MecI/CopY family transcriptional regulator [Gemmatimonadaceae bacterium]|jgi:Predicted transcriptional regulator